MDNEYKYEIPPVIGTIDRFEDRFAFLSNFYMAPVEYEGLKFTNNEAAFQAQKNPRHAAEFTKLPPSKAKYMGRRMPLRPDWEQAKVQIMYEICTAKFKQNKLLAKLLLDTGDATLIEGNTWNDTFWGVCRGRGQNNLGIILMRVREELKNGKEV